MATRKDADKLVLALVDFAKEHGVPNNITPGELEWWHGAPAAMVTGRVAREWNAYVLEELAKHGLRYEYRDRCFHLTEVPKP